MTGGREAARWEAERVTSRRRTAFIEDRIRSEITGASEALTLRQAAVPRSSRRTARGARADR